MAILVCSFILFLVMISALALGVLSGRAPISGSCGGVAGQCRKDGRKRGHDSVHCMAGCQQHGIQESQDTAVLYFSNSPEERR